MRTPHHHHITQFYDHFQLSACWARNGVQGERGLNFTRILSPLPIHAELFQEICHLNDSLKSCFSVRNGIPIPYNGIPIPTMLYRFLQWYTDALKL